MFLVGALALLLAAAEPEAPPPPAPAPPPAAAESASAHRIRLGVGTQKVLAVGRLRAVAVAAPGVLDVRPLGATELLLVGLAKGHSDLTVFIDDARHETWRIDVGLADDVNGRPCETCQVVLDSPELKFEFLADRTIVSGLLGSLEDYERLKSFPHVVFMARLDPRVVAERVRAVNEALARSGLKDAQAVLHGNRVLALEGSVQDAADGQKAVLIATTLFEPVAQVLEELARAETSK